MLDGREKEPYTKNRTNIHRTTVSCKEEAERFWSRNVNWNRRNWIFKVQFLLFISVKIASEL